jgi:hypothetical protein
MDNSLTNSANDPFSPHKGKAGIESCLSTACVRRRTTGRFSPCRDRSASCKGRRQRQAANASRISLTICLRAIFDMLEFGARDKNPWIAPK